VGEWPALFLRRVIAPMQPGCSTRWLCDLRHRWRFVPDTWVTLFVCSGKQEVSMPWKESSVMDERLGFVARLLVGEEMTDLCREFGISRKTGDKIYGRSLVPRSSSSS